MSPPEPDRAPPGPLPAPPAPTPADATLSVIVATRDDRARLPGCLGALRAARAAGAVDQVLVADAGSTDATAEIARGHGAIVVPAEGSVAARFAAGAAVASGGWLLFLRPDARLAPGWAEALDRHRARSDGADHAAVFRLSFDEVSPAAERALRRAGGPGRLAPGQAVALSHRLYDAVGGIRPAARVPEADLARRLGPDRLVLLNAAVCLSGPRHRPPAAWRRWLARLHARLVPMDGTAGDPKGKRPG
jgi:glycosyltransferase involved in cell wall biosynthesis